MTDSLEQKSFQLHISLYEMPDGMYIASCAEVPSCKILRNNKEHAFTEARSYVLQFLREREAEGRPFTLPEIREVTFRINTNRGDVDPRATESGSPTIRPNFDSAATGHLNRHGSTGETREA